MRLISDEKLEIKTMKKAKNKLKRDTVVSDSFHVGIELELIVECENTEHDDEACRDSRERGDRENYDGMSSVAILRDHFCLSNDEARSLENYFDHNQWVNDVMDDWQDNGCDNDDCGYHAGSGSDARDNLASALRELTGNTSIKVVEDGSINHGSDETDAEVCWNYFASKETFEDNKKIMHYLKEKGCDFNRSCGLHINLNNYLKLETPDALPKKALSFLFDFVGDSRSTSNYCNNNAISSDTKYSMIYNQTDRLEFRFFSPTLDAEKLHHYVILAHTVYKRLAGLNAKLPKKTMTYFFDKLVSVNGRTKKVAANALKQVNSLPSYTDLLNPPEKNMVLEGSL